MYSGQLVFAQLMEHLPLHTFRRCVQRYPSKYPTKTFSHLDQFLCMDFAMSLIQIARKLYANDSFAMELEQTVYALDTTTIDLCLSVFPWARFRSAKAAVKMHTLLDLRGNIPTFIHISDGKMHEVNVLDILIPEAGSFYIMDRGFTDFARWFALHKAQAFFVIRGKSNLLFRRIYSRTVEKSPYAVIKPLH